jgi:malate dehydrogenase (oxaloacetate-decarboxylating)
MARERGIEIASLEQLMAEADVVVATSGRPGLIEPGMVRDGQVILALTNPDPRDRPGDGARRGRRLRRRWHERQQRPRLPGIFRGALLAGRTRSTRR